MSNCEKNVSGVPPTCFSALFVCINSLSFHKGIHFVCMYTSGTLRRALLSSACVFSGCTCVTAGTIQSACSDGQCDCDRQTGACPCRENVVGHNCDQCAPNHWNYGQERGCEPCGCDSQHAMGTHCNMVRKHGGPLKAWKKLMPT